MTRRRNRSATRPHGVECTCHVALSVTCIHVIARERPVLMMWRDPQDGTLVLSCGRGAHDDVINDWGMAHPVHFMANDPAMGIMRTLSGGRSVRRDRVGSPWHDVTDEVW